MGQYHEYVYSYQGSKRFYKDSLSNVRVLTITRDGDQYDEVTTTPVGRQCQYVRASGEFLFDENIYNANPPFGRFRPERILVTYTL